MRVGVRVVSNHLPKLSRAMTPRASWAVADELGDLKADARRFAPVDEGDLRDSIDVEFPPGSLAGALVATVPHAAPQEFGFRHWISGNFIPAQPFFRPASILSQRRFPKRVAGHLGALARGL